MDFIHVTKGKETLFGYLKGFGCITTHPLYEYLHIYRPVFLQTLLLTGKNVHPERMRRILYDSFKTFWNPGRHLYTKEVRKS